MIVKLQRSLLQTARENWVNFLDLWATVQPTVELEKTKIYIEENFSKIMRTTIRNGSYEKEELEIVKSQLTQNDIVMEIGTGIGLLSSYCAKKIGSERVFTFEANPQMEPYIRKTYKLNQVSPNFEICIIGESVGEGAFYIDENFYASSTLETSVQSHQVTVAAKSFNEEVKRINPTLLIIDIEGGEYDLAKYAEFYNVRKIIIEVHEHIIGKDKVDFFKSKVMEAGFQINEKISIDKVIFFEKKENNNN